MECEYCGKYIVDTESAIATYLFHLLITHNVDPKVKESHEGRLRHYWHEDILPRH